MKSFAAITSRRSVLMASAALGGASVFGLFSRLATAAIGDTIVVKPGKVTIQRFTDLGKSIGMETVDKVIKTEDEWKKLLASVPQPQLAFEVTRQEGTEAPFTGPNWDNHATTGLYRCICCDNALYDAATKYDSGTGWPSFWEPIQTNALILRKDDSIPGEPRVEVLDKCGGHLGHVFDDGPQPTGKRYCMNSIAMYFVPDKKQ